MITRRILSWLSIAIMSWSIVGCTNTVDTIETVQAFEDESKPPIPKVEKIVEVSPPKLISKLNQNFAKTKPQVQILSPLPDEVIDSQDVSVQFAVTGLETFKNSDLKMGPHLHFFVDNQPYQAVYDTSKPIELKNLSPGTHTLRVFASRPWHESFKNRGAYAQTTFHIFTTTDENNPQPNQALLTYSRPQGAYGAQPIMLDFYLTDAPLHVVAQESPDDDIADWRIRVTVNGESFLLDKWQPLYLEGFDKGVNWVKVEYIDENGDLIKNVFNSSVRAITYDPSVNDTLTKLVKNKISLQQATAIVKQNIEVVETVEPVEPVEAIEPETGVTAPETVEIPEAVETPEEELLEEEVEIEIIEEIETPVVVDENENQEEEIVGESAVNKVESDTTVEEVEEMEEMTIESGDSTPADETPITVDESEDSDNDNQDVIEEEVI